MIIVIAQAVGRGEVFAVGGRRKRMPRGGHTGIGVTHLRAVCRRGRTSSCYMHSGVSSAAVYSCCRECKVASVVGMGGGRIIGKLAGCGEVPSCSKTAGVANENGCAVSELRLLFAGKP